VVENRTPLTRSSLRGGRDELNKAGPLAGRALTLTARAPTVAAIRAADRRAELGERGWHTARKRVAHLEGAAR
jgi:hypothetical protein